MHTPTIFDRNYEVEVDKYSIPEDKLHHLENVLRIKQDSLIKVTNGRGLVSTGVKFNEYINVLETNLMERDSEINIFISKLQDKTRMRLVIEKLTELGVNSITIGPTENSQKMNININKINNWIVGAIEQSGIAFAPEVIIENKLDFNKFNHSFDISGANVKTNSGYKNFAIGPEGGWSQKELDSFRHISKLSNFTLRSDTAALVAVSLMM